MTAIPQDPYPPGHRAGPRLDIDNPDRAPLPIDTLRALFTYTLGMIVVVGGGLMIFVTRNEAAASEIRLLIAGFIGSVLTFMFGQETQTRTARQAAASTAASTAATTASIAAANSGVGAGTNGAPPAR